MASLWKTRTRFLLLAVMLLIGINVARQGYRWFAFADERESLRRLSVNLDSAALAVMRTQIRADSLRGAIEEADDRLVVERRALTALERRADGHGLPATLYEEYQRGLNRYNEHVATRNSDYERWREVVTHNHRAVDGYNALSDSIRSVGTRMGEPYISIPSPAEVAVRHGLDTASSLLGPLPDPAGP